MSQEQPQVSPHTGFTVMRLENGHHKDDAKVRAKYAWLRDFLSDYTGHPFHFFYDIQQPDVIIMMGGWNSIEEHYQQLHRSAEFVNVLEEFGGVLDVEASFHTTMPLQDMLKGIDAPLVVLTRTWLEHENTENFENAYKKWKPLLIPIMGREAAWGWRTHGGWTDKADVNMRQNQVQMLNNGEYVPPEDQELDTSELKEAITIVGFDDMTHHDKVLANPEFRKHYEYHQYTKCIYVRFLKPLDLTVPSDYEESDEDASDDE